MTNKLFSSVALMALIALLHAGCASTDSGDVKTKGIYPEYTAIYNGNSLTLKARFRMGPSSDTYVDLNSGDRIFGVVGNTEVLLKERKDIILGTKFYMEDINGKLESNAIRFNLDRSEEDDAPNSDVVIPESFDITSPENYSEFSRAAGLTIEWSPSGSDAHTEINVSGCVKSNIFSLNKDNGAYTIPPAYLALNEGETASKCYVFINITRSNNGKVDPIFRKGGDIRGEQVRSLTLTSVP